MFPSELFKIANYLEKMKALIWKDTCTPMFIEALFTIAKRWKQPKCPSADEWINRWVDKEYIHIYI